MTKEQAIEILEGLQKSNEACIKNSKIEDTPFTTIWKRQNESIETILSMLEEKDKEIQFQNDINKMELDRHNKTEKNLKGIIKKQNKIIDLMAEFIEDELTVDEFCTKEDCYADNYIDGHCEKCLNCIKQYFENKAKERR